jgi:uncharacterized damage-inducible protein DinB
LSQEHFLPAPSKQSAVTFTAGLEEKNMHKTSLTIVSLVLVLAAAACAADQTPPSYDMKGQSLFDLQALQKKFVDLANALPADKLTWRPSPDSRSFAEVFLHVAGERYGILSLMGATPPASYDRKTFEKSTTDKAKIVDELNKSWDFTQKTINDMSNADFAKLLPKLGPQANAGDVVYILVADAHEHLGQSVAYARENGIVPPWTVEAKKKAAEKPAQK